MGPYCVIKPFLYRPAAQRDRADDSLSCAPKAYVKFVEGQNENKIVKCMICV